MILFITGGVRSGKTKYAQKLALSLSENPVYVATAKDWGGDFTERIKRHQSDRGAEWINYETQKYVSVLPIKNKVTVIDCVTLWLTNFFIEYKTDIDLSLKAFKSEIDALCNMSGTFIIVSNEIGMGIHAESETGRKFTDLQGWANQYAASKADQVVLLVSGIPVTIKKTIHEI
ncbi:MAG: bifunctional adenosylcobinamide kinase/adenosylcobinamide-phosphate guanylyltransferase [Chitinophagaceae bacterium]